MYGAHDRGFAPARGPPAFNLSDSSPGTCVSEVACGESSFKLKFDNRFFKSLMIN